MKKHDLKVINLVPPAKGEVLDHLEASIKTLFADKSPVVGYAIVTFHENKSYGTSHHTTKAGIHQVDLPDMVRNRLLANTIKL